MCVPADRKRSIHQSRFTEAPGPLAEPLGFVRISRSILHQSPTRGIRRTGGRARSSHSLLSSGVDSCRGKGYRIAAGADLRVAKTKRFP